MQNPRAFLCKKSGGLWVLKTTLREIEPASNLLGSVPLPAEMGWLRPPRGHGIFGSEGLLGPVGMQFRLSIAPIKSPDWTSALLNSTTMQVGSSIQTNMEGKAIICVVVPKSAQSLNLRYKTPELSFARKALPSGCLAAHFSKGSLLALHQNLGRGDGHTDQVLNPIRPKNKLPFSSSVHNIDMQYDFSECCFPIKIFQTHGPVSHLEYRHPPLSSSSTF